jgi:hypothetical protein
MEGGGKKMKVADLRFRCHSLGLATSGDREALQERLKEKNGAKTVEEAKYALPLDVVVLILSLTIERPSDLLTGLLVCKPVAARLQTNSLAWSRLFREDRDALKGADDVLGRRPWKLQNGRLIKEKRDKKQGRTVVEEDFGDFDEWLEGSFSEMDGEEEGAAQHVVVPELTFAQRKALVIAKCKADRLWSLICKDPCLRDLQRLSPFFAGGSCSRLAVLGGMASFCHTLEDDEVLFPFQTITLAGLRHTTSEKKAKGGPAFLKKLSSFNPPVRIVMTIGGTYALYVEEATATGIVLFA